MGHTRTRMRNVQEARMRLDMINANENDMYVR